MDLETFFTTLYVLIDDWYKAEIAPHEDTRCGAKPQMGTSEILTLGIAGQWRVGVAWDSERGMIRYLQAYGRGLFPRLLERSAYNRQFRQHYGVFLRLQAWVATQLNPEVPLYECVDSYPLRACSLSQVLRESQHWLWESERGHGGTQGGWYWGDKWLVSVTPTGYITGWMVGSANLHDRWLLEALLTGRARHYCLRLHLPLSFLGTFSAVGNPAACPYLADRAFNGERWRIHWQQQYQAQVIAAPPANTRQAWSPHDQRWLASHRQIIETVFAVLDHVFALKRLRPHSRWGQSTRLAAIAAAFNLALFINTLHQRAPLALATLLV